MRQSVLSASNLKLNKVSVKDIVVYLDKTIDEKDDFMRSTKSHISNPSIKESYLKAESVKDFAEYLKMAIKTNSPHYLK